MSVERGTVEVLPAATQILDFYHASERLHAVARAVYGEGTQAARQWAERSVARLSAGDWKGLLCSLKALRPKTRDGTEAVTVLALRTPLLNDRWDDYWQPLKAAA